MSSPQNLKINRRAECQRVAAVRSAIVAPVTLASPSTGGRERGRRGRRSYEMTSLSVMTAVLLGLFVPACEVGPNYQQPAVAQPAQFKSTSTSQPTTQSLTQQWWKLYHDPTLTLLIDEADAHNQNLQQAVARLDEARALAKEAGSYLLPTVTLDPSYTRTHTSGTVLNPLSGEHAPQVTYNTGLVPFDLSYEIDVWGRMRRQVETAGAQARASEFDLAAVRLTTQTDVATYYFAVRSLDAQAKILVDNLNAYREQVRIVEVQLKNGLVAPTDVYQAKAQRDSTDAQLQDIRRARADEEHALATLCGLAAPVFAVLPNPLENPVPPLVPAGLPANLLTSRPDVAEAEQNLIAANAQVGVATANFYPAFNLTGNAGFESASFTSIFDWQSKIASIGPSVSIPIFEGGRLVNTPNYQKARSREFNANYVNQVLSAYADVENALTDLRSHSDEVTVLKEAVQLSQGYRRLSNAQYGRGLVNYLSVIDAERTLLANQLTLAQTVNQQMAASIHLIKALGGGWSASN